MDEARKKLRMCLIFIVLFAVIVGCIYYFGEKSRKNNVSEGTLVIAQTESRV